MNIQEIMSAPAITCRPNDNLNTVAGLMWDRDCGAVPVVDDSGTAIGMITDRDICMAVYTQGRPMHAIPVSAVMSAQVFACHAGDSLEAAERLMSDKQIRRIPIVDGENKPVGVLSLNDIARFAAAKKTDGLDHELTRTLAAVCQPRSRALATQPH